MGLEIRSMTPQVGDIWTPKDRDGYFLLIKRMSADGDFEVLRLDKASEGLYNINQWYWRFVA